MKLAFFFMLTLDMLWGGLRIAEAQSSAPANGITAPGLNGDRRSQSPQETMITLGAYRIEFKPQAEIPNLTASPVISLPILCAESGTPFISVPDPPSYSERTIYALDEKQPRQFSYRSVEGFYDTHFVSFFPGKSGVWILVNATRESQKSRYVVDSGNGGASRMGVGFRGEHHDFVMKFDYSGTYKSTIQLPDDLSFHRLAELDDGNFLTVAYDRPNRVARLVLLSPDGRFLRRLTLPSELEKDEALQKGRSGSEIDSGLAESTLSRWQFAPVRHRILLYATRKNAPVLEVGAGGTLREVAVSAPRGYVLAGIISSNERWIFRYSLQNTPEHGHTNSGNSVLFEVDPSDGTLVREIQLVSGPAFGISCETDGLLTGFSVSPGGKYLSHKADFPK